ncbi:MAG: hypothetical protein ACFFDN_09820 [Candidatus Hodarchaeota archaeon]
MSNIPEEKIPKQIEELLLQAEDEVRKYNWEGTIEILKNIEKISIDEKFKEIKGNLFCKLGEIYHIAADFKKNADEVLNYFKLSISYFQKAHNIFTELKIEERIDACLGFINLINYISGTEKNKEEFLLDSAKKYFKKAKIIYLKNGDSINSLKMAIFESIASTLFITEKIIRIDEQTNFKELTTECEKLITELWKNIKNETDFPEIYTYHFLVSVLEFFHFVFAFLPTEILNVKQYILDNMDRFKEFIDIFEKSAKKLCLFNAYSIYANLHMFYALLFVDNQFELKKYVKTAEKSIRKGEKLLVLINGNPFLTLFYFTRFTNAIFLVYLGFFTKDFKHIMKDFDFLVGLIPLYFPKIMVAHLIFYLAGIFLVVALNRSMPDTQRINFARNSLNLMELLTNKIPLVKNLNYKIYNLTLDVGLCAANAVLGDLIKNKEEQSKHLRIASKIFNNLSDYDYYSIRSTQVYYQFLNSASRTGILLAENSSNKSEKVNYYQMVIDFLLKSKNMIFFLFYQVNLFLIGDIYFKIGILTNDEEILKKSYLSYIDAIDYCKNKGYFNLVGSAYVIVAQIEDRLGNFLSAAKNYQNAINYFDQAIMTLTYTKLGKKIEKLKNYVEAWNIIETAKSFHTREDHQNAQLNYEQASQILNNIREYKFESPFYYAWGILEKAEYLSKINKHEEAVATYLVAKNQFQEAIEIFNSALKKRKTFEEIDRISKLIQVAEFRGRYCIARHQIETARIESKKGNHLFAAELYNKAGTIFKDLCQLFGIKREKDELLAVYYLCKAWLHMERAEIEQKSSLYKIASDLFQKACNIFPESRMKKLSIANSNFCSALEYGSLFDNSTELEEKVNYYKKIKMYLRESSKNYQLGGFKQDAQWSLATSTFFDGIWHLIQSDNEIDFTKKNQYLNLATNYLNNALNIFDNAGYVQKKEEISNYLEMIKDEKDILAHALNIIERPEISASSIGISAPSCPIEISSSVDIGEMQRTDFQTESELNWHKRIDHIYFFMPNGICIFDHSFKAEKDIEAQLVSGGLTGISALIQEVTKSKTKIKIVEQEETNILFEHGKYISIALITEENLITLRKKLEQLMQDVENFYQEELEDYSGNLSVFSKIGKFVQKIFEN